MDSRGSILLCKCVGVRFNQLALLPINSLRVASLLAVSLIAVNSQAADVGSDFDNVAPIFAAHCIRCHNDIDQKGDFSLQTGSSLSASGFAQAGDESSHLLSVIEGAEPSMPKDADPLSTAEVETIRRWILDGANWPSAVRIGETISDFEWWSFKPIQPPSVPLSGSPWIRTPIDAFVLARQNKLGLTHSDDADRRTLIRRLTYDLIGLPPTPSEIESFASDPDPLAYEKLADRLLDSKHYGEHWARHWLDVVKYADTCGYDKDKLRPNAWPYRDYVIRSLNEGKPYWRFVQEQIAGDVLFKGQPDGILGLGFIAAGPWDFIGHVEVPESKIDGKVARNLDRDEMVTNTINTFCSVTIQCARCHNHKFDPFTQEHYYSLQAIFAAVDRAERPYDLDPDVQQRRDALNAQLTRLRDEKASLEKEMEDAGGPELVELNQQIAELGPKVSVQKEPAFGYHSGIASTPLTEKWVEVDLGRDIALSKIVLRPCHDDFAGIGPGFGFPVRYKVETRCADGDPADSYATLRATTNNIQNPGLTPIEIDATAHVARFVRVTALKLAERKNDYIFALAELQVFDDQGENVAKGSVVSSLDSIEAPVRWAKQNLVDGIWARPSDQSASTKLAGVKQKKDAMLARIQTAERLERQAKIQAAIQNAKQELAALPEGKMVYAAATNFQPQSNFKPTGGKPRPVHLLHRGDVQHPLDLVQPGLLPLREDDDWKLDAEANESQRRAELARWLTHREHPLLWRSIVNRVWQYHFGRGLVATSNDFGRMGAQPTHSDLLDWLAIEFRDNGQSLKQLHRLIVTSSVYRQSSDFDSSSGAIDGSNQFLWRMNRRRLTAEEIRDSILAVSGSLDTRMGGPGFYLFKLEKPEHSPHFEYHQFDPADSESHRRSIYRFIVRSQPDPYMTTLDCADSSQSTPRRVETLTSLQALSLLNNRFNLEMAKRFADRLQTESDQPDVQVDRAMMLVAGRLPNDEERSELVGYAKRHGLPNMCRMMFNLSEFVFLD